MIGQEATAVGCCAALTSADQVYSSHRTHGAYLAKGGDLKARVPIGKGVHRRRGRDLTEAGVSHTLELSLQAASSVAAEGVDVEVIDLRTVKPLDETIILESVRKTGRLLVVDTAWEKGGLCAEVGCLAAEKAFEHLRAPVRRIGFPDVPTPAGFALEQRFYPDVQRLAATMREMVGEADRRDGPGSGG
ncbi:MAG: hypothetical protein FJW23_01855 [Acidimicrobiia bacterium]|nr:hypothetical protein [Acidimicrobiia bacterium]